MTEPVLLRADRDHVATLTLNRPQARNALSAELILVLNDALEIIAQDRSVHVVVIAGNGPAFCAGHDLRELRAIEGIDAHRTLFAACSAMMTRVVRLPQPVIASVHGIATAAGCQLVASCDLAVAGQTARFATPGVNIGLFCSTPMVALSRVVGRRAAMDMLLTGAPIDAARALAIGLVSEVVDDDMLRAATDALARRIAQHSPAAIAIGKRAFHEQAALDLDAAYRVGGEAMARNMQADDAAEGIDAFLDRRAPVWRGS